MSELQQILAEIKSSEDSSAARKRWNPNQQGQIDIRIATDGSWYHDGRKFQRPALVKLFAGVLRREDSGYYLVTPVEKLRIEVEDAPFTANLVERIDDNGDQAIVFTTNVGDRIVLDPNHALRIEIDDQTGEPRPYVHVRDGLEALIGRGAFYDLINLADERERDGKTCLVVTSLGREFELGSTDE